MSTFQAKRQECLNNLIKNARSNRFSLLRKLATSDQEVYNVWDTISQLVENNMKQRKAVHIPGLGIFTFTSSKLDIGHNKYILIQRPVFILSEKLVKTHRLTQSKYHVPGEIPVTQLNFTALAIDINVSRDLVEASVKEIVNALSRSIEKTGSCEFAFTTIGNLIVSNGTAKMKFLPGFLEQMDTSGNLTKFLAQRPGTSGSILPDNSMLLPKIQPGDSLKSNTSKSPDIETIKEEEDNELQREDNASNNKSGSSQSPRKEKEILTPTLKVEARSPRIQQLTLSQEHSKPSTPPYSPSTPPKKTPANLKRAVTFKEPKQEIEIKQTRVFPSPRPSKLQIINELKKTNKSPPPQQQQQQENRCSNCVESMNDFCYLCYQREKRNVPVYFADERQQEEQEEDHLLQMFTLLKDKEAMQLQEDMNRKKREEAQQIARFNLATGEANKEKQKDKFQRSFVFRNRPITPPHYIKQEDYQTDLAKQVSDRAKKAKCDQRGKENLERLEQLELAQDLAWQRDYLLKRKRLQSDEYRKALDTQVYIKKCLDERNQENSGRTFVLPRPNVLLPFQANLRLRSSRINMMKFKPSQLPSAYPDSDGPVFGIHDMNSEKLKERRKTAQNLYQNQLYMASEKKRLESMRNSKKRKEEEDVLRKTKLDLLQETLTRNQLNLTLRQDLEKTWARQALKKRAREIEDNLRARSPGLLLQEQCDKYSRCGQCTRHQHNYGQSNVWSETRYVSGSRLMV